MNQDLNSWLAAALIAAILVISMVGIGLNALSVS